jgi:hypothetical protein
MNGPVFFFWGRKRGGEGKKMAGNEDTVHVVDQLRMKLAKMKNW